VGTVDGVVRGYCYFRWGEETKSFVGENEAGLTGLYVEPDYWGKGSARRCSSTDSNGFRRISTA